MYCQTNSVLVGLHVSFHQGCRKILCCCLKISCPAHVCNWFNGSSPYLPKSRRQPKTFYHLLYNLIGWFNSDQLWYSLNTDQFDIRYVLRFLFENNSNKSTKIHFWFYFPWPFKINGIAEKIMKKTTVGISWYVVSATGKLWFCIIIDQL